MEDNVGIPEDLRCKRSDGKQWRCSALSMPDKTVCEKHYIQAKKRAANSALRASLKKAKRKSLEDADVYLESKHEGREVSRSMSPMNPGSGEFSGSGGSMKKYKERVPKGQAPYSSETMSVRGSFARGGSLRRSEDLQRDTLQADENRFRSIYNTPPSSKEAKNFSGIGPGEYSGKSSDSSGGAEGLTCHQCRRNDRADVVWCTSCDRRGYCDNCISRWYAEIPMEDIRRVCPACRGICNCKVCLRGDNLIKAKIQEIAPVDKLRYLHTLLAFVLPALKQIYAEQCFEIGVETRVYGQKADIPRANINADEQMCCDFCKIPIFDYHRHCTKCFYDLCLTCCRDLRQAPVVNMRGQSTEGRVSERSKDVVAPNKDKSQLHSEDKNPIDFAHLFPKWKANSDGSIQCGPIEANGCGSSKLILRRIFKINWVVKLLKNAEEMVNGCKVSDPGSIDKCLSCMGSKTSLSGRSSESLLRQCSNRYDSGLFYHPVLEDLKQEGIAHFHKHWAKGEPVIVKHVFEHSLASSWDPLSIWRGIQETTDERLNENIIVKAVDCLNHSEVDIELNQFIKGYSEGRKHEDGWPQMLKLKDWPPPSTLEEFLLCHRPEFLVNFPLVEFIHSKWGILNLVAKLPHDTLQTEVAPKLFIAYGTHEELGRGDSVANLQINMVDQVYLLMHTAEVNNQTFKKSEMDKNEKTFKEFDAKRSLGNANIAHSNMNVDERTAPLDLTQREHGKEKECSSGLKFKEDNTMENLHRHSEMASLETKELDSSHSAREIVGSPEKGSAGAIWDVFLRQDVPKLNEYLKVHGKEFTVAGQPYNSVMHPVYDQVVFLNDKHKRTLNDEYGIEPWTFKQHVGEAVFIPTGCPFQVRNLQGLIEGYYVRDCGGHVRKREQKKGKKKKIKEKRLIRRISGKKQGETLYRLSISGCLQLCLEKLWKIVAMLMI
uniref:Lysine-specific demethylase JMJ25 isoform X2 n=1 Tax=Elaeis guineensis var. tenera TaxID=51953 RepID=A0A8N4F738_ELAGV|nr:lysine-specific demethylase JMJ25 isoform X2 [Elaeis guineensis]